MMSDNLTIWNALSKTDPKHTKKFKRSGGFSGTAIKPIYMTQKMTEQFGPAGQGWGMTAPKFEVVPGHNGEVLVYCTVAMWWKRDDDDYPTVVHGVGGDKVVSYIKANQQYNRPERWENDDEAFKKAYTDALSNAMKQIGMGADVHMGQHDDDKYVSSVRRELEAQEAPVEGKVKGGVNPGDESGWDTRTDDLPDLNLTQIADRGREFAKDLASCLTEDELNGLLQAKETIHLFEQMRTKKPQWYHGNGGDVPSMDDRIAHQRTTIRQLAEQSRNVAA